MVWIHEVIGEAESLVVRDKSVTDLKGLKGARSRCLRLDRALLAAAGAPDEGMDQAKDVKLINLAPETMASAWQGEQIDAAWVWDPVLTS